MLLVVKECPLLLLMGLEEGEELVFSIMTGQTDILALVVGRRAEIIV